MSKAMAVALQQGYPLDPIKYQSDSEYINEVRKMADESKGVLGIREELVLLRAHLQEVEMLWNKEGHEALTMKAGRGVVPMSDDVKIDRLVKLTEAISKLSRDQYVITESDYVSVAEIKVWLWEIWQAVTKHIKRVVTGEINVNDLEKALQADFREIPLPKTGRKYTRK